MLLSEVQDPEARLKKLQDIRTRRIGEPVDSSHRLAHICSQVATSRPRSTVPEWQTQPASYTTPGTEGRCVQADAWTGPSVPVGDPGLLPQVVRSGTPEQQDDHRNGQCFRLHVGS